MFLPDINDLLADASGMAPAQEVALGAPLLPGVLPNTKGKARKSVLESLEVELEAEKEKVDTLTLDLEKCEDKLKAFQKTHGKHVPTEPSSGQPAPIRHPKVSPETLKVAKRVFRRYDFDASGTLNSIEEAQQMTMNMLFSLGYVCSPEEVPVNTPPRVPRTIRTQLCCLFS